MGAAGVSEDPYAALHLPPFPDGAIGFVIYEGSQFKEFIPNEPELASVAGAFADEVEAFAAEQG